MTTLGLVSAAAQYGYQSIIVKPKRSIGSFVADVVFEEVHNDDIEITDHPVERGAVVADHAFKRPAEVVIRCGWSNSPPSDSLIGGVVGAVDTALIAASSIQGRSSQQIADIYQKLLKLQSDCVPFDVMTGKRKYVSMLLRSLAVTTDEQNENVLGVVVRCRQILIVSTQTVKIGVSSDPSNQKEAQNTAAPVDKGTKALISAPNYNASQ